MAIFVVHGYARIADGISLELERSEKDRLWNDRKQFGSLALFRAAASGTRKPKMWNSRTFESLNAAKQFADERIEGLAPGNHVILEIEERAGPRATEGRIKYRVEHDASGNVIPSPALV